MVKSIKFSKKVILLTGGTGYLGTAMAIKILESGANLIITSRDKRKLLKFFSKLKKDHKKNCYIVSADLTKENDVNKLIYKIKKKYKYINGLVNNAYSGKIGEIRFIDNKDFLNSASINLYAPFKLIKNFWFSSFVSII